MLTLKGIKKQYVVGDQKVDALKGIDLAFRRSEFVSILGPSGCGKTTLLNLIGGLDRYTEGEMTINSVSTKKYNDADWDAYRNHSVGFVFQNYNLIPHQTVLSNVELALTLSGVSKSERRKRAVAVLERVGLGDQLNKKPNQMSGGQMQRVAIARALVNDPDILLADEPTGALDSATSVQVMDLMREIAQDRLVIMVTHNPELAEQYSTRIIKLLDGRVIDDSDPFDPAQETSVTEKIRHTNMRFGTALSLSFNNLLTKKARTLLTAFAGSIGIIGIALILSLSNGINNYINRVEEDTLSSYPLTIQQQTVDMSGMLNAMMGNVPKGNEHEDGKVYSVNIMGKMFNSMLSQVTTNDTASFKQFLEDDEQGVTDLVSDIKYSYPTELYVYGKNVDGSYVQVNPNTMFDSIGFTGEMSSMYSTTTSMAVWNELIDNQRLLDSQFDVVAGRMPESYDEIVLFIHESNTIDDFSLYSLGLKDQSDLSDILSTAMQGGEMPTEESSWTYDELLNLRYRLIVGTDFYQKQDGAWKDMRGDGKFLTDLIERSPELKVVGILRPSPDAVNTSANGTVGYTAALTEYLVNAVNSSEIVAEQIANPDTDVFTNLPFAGAAKAEDAAMPDLSQYSEEQLAYFNKLPDEQKQKIMESMGLTGTVKSTSTYEKNMALLGVADLARPSMINIYPRDFAAKEELTGRIEAYNQRMIDEGREDMVIQYTDYVEIIMSSVNTIINAISYVLIAFVSISLIVSSIMIGIITYISVLERTKEIGILRAIGASKRDIGNVFNAETLIVGFTAGMLGILVSFLLTIPINAIIQHLTDISGVAELPVAGAVILVLISMFLTWIAGLIPSAIASRKDPVVALRSE